MYHTIAANSLLYRVTLATYSLSQWKTKVLSGRGAFYGPQGGRYNNPGVQAAYLADTPGAAIAEGGFYAAKEWLDERYPSHYGRPVTFPHVSRRRALWCFKTTAPITVVDLEDAAAPATFNYFPALLTNPRQDYRATQHLAGQVLTHAAPAHPRPQAGLKAPSVRARHRTGAPPSSPTQTVLFVAAVIPSLVLEQRWDLTLEFRDTSGLAASANSDRIDWETAFATVNRPRRVPPAIQSPMGFPLNATQTVWVSHT